MNLIIAEHKVRDIVNQIPDIDLNKNHLGLKPKFGWGDKFELNRYLEVKKEGSYPLIWMLPTTESHIDGGMSLKKDCSFIIAHLEKNVSLFNDERYLKSYDLVLNPLTNYLIQGLRSSSISMIVGDEWNIFKHPNYSDEKSGEEHGTIALWDAVRLDCTVEFNNHCLKTIVWQSPKKKSLS